MDSLRSVQLLLSCEHGGNKIPAEYQELFSPYIDLLGTHRGYDIGALSTAQMLQLRLQRPLVYCEISRLLIDTNRYLDGRGPFSEISQSLSSEDKKKVIDQYYRPHWDQIIDLCRQSIESKNQSVLHLAIHSMTDNLDGQIRLMDLALLFDPKRSFETKFVNLWQTHLQTAFPEFNIVQNEPYRGDDEGMTSFLRTQFVDATYAGIELELNQAMLQKLGQRGKQKLHDGLAESLQHALQELAQNS